MLKRRVGCDVDGVLACFVTGFADRLAEIAGDKVVNGAVLRQLAKDTAAFPTVWDWPQLHGYTNDDVRAAWESVEQDDTFWQNLPVIEPEAVELLNALAMDGHEVYFLTARLGIKAKWQTEQWLLAHGMLMPTVIITEQKAPVAKALELDCYIDDKLSNVNLVMRSARAGHSYTRVYIKDRLHNRKPITDDLTSNKDVNEWRDAGVQVVSGVVEMLTCEGFLDNTVPDVLICGA